MKTILEDTQQINNTCVMILRVVILLIQKTYYCVDFIKLKEI